MEPPSWSGQKGLLFGSLSFLGTPLHKIERGALAGSVAFIHNGIAQSLLFHLTESVEWPPF